MRKLRLESQVSPYNFFIAGADGTIGVYQVLLLLIVLFSFEVLPVAGCGVRTSSGLVYGEGRYSRAVKMTLCSQL